MTPEWHESRQWAGRDKERFPDCTCVEAVCGYVTPDDHCPEHSIRAGKSIRRSHPADRCPGVPIEVITAPPPHRPVRTER